MGTQEKFLLNIHFRLLNMGSVYLFLHQKLVLSATSFWVHVSTLIFAPLGFFKTTILSARANHNYQMNNSKSLEFDSNCVDKEAEAKEPEVDVAELKDTEFKDSFICSGKENGNNQTNNSDGLELDSNWVQQDAEDKEPEVDVAELKVTEEKDDLKGKESPKFFFKFQFQTYKENYESYISDSVPSTSTNKFEFSSGKGLCHYLEEPDVVNLTVKELYADSENGFVGNKGIFNSGVLSNEGLVETKGEADSVHEGIQQSSADNECKEEVMDKLEPDTFVEESISRKGKQVDVDNNVFSDEDSVSKDSVQVLSEKDFIALDSCSDSITSSHEIINGFVPSTSYGFFADKDFEDEFGLGRDIDAEEVELTEEDLELEDIHFEFLSAKYEADDFYQEDNDIMEELKRFEEPIMENSGNVDSEKLSKRDFQGNNNFKQEESCNDNGTKDCLDNPDKSDLRNSWACDSEDSNGLEILWEHQDFIEQLKMELKKARATGLPTILEEDECPKIIEDFKPWKIDEKFQHEDKMGELHKFYKSYRERMRKYDILNIQKMYAMGFLQSKDPLQSFSSHKASNTISVYPILQKFLLHRGKKSNSDPMMNFIRELHSDLEMVYVGQMCLSWEILHWQYEQALELWDSDPYAMRQYNEVAGEFQQFQVLLQRFVENEPFEDPRVENYVKKRFVSRNLLQVPVIREDRIKERKARRKGKDDDAITSDMLVEIMEESIRIFWQFVRADKDAHNVIQKGRKGTQIEPQDPTELELLTKVRMSLQKKEKKLKDILRSGNCILKRFKKHQEENSDQVLYFFSQVDMKLVSRVLNMSKITMDQLLWCHSKLSKINFVSHKIHVEPSFLLFPC